MPRIFTVAQVVTRARRMASMEGASGLRFVTAAEARSLVSQAWTWLHGMLVKADPDAFEATQTITTTGAASYPLPADWLTSKRVDYEYSDNQHEQLRRITSRDLLSYETTSSTTSTGATAYRIVGGNITLYPTPQAGQTYRHIYTPMPEDLDEDTDEIDGRAGWEEILVLRVASKMKAKAEEETAALDAELEKEIQRVVLHADDLVPQEGAVIADVESYSDDWSRRYPRMV